jgi:hypothetical protein
MPFDNKFFRARTALTAFRCACFDALTLEKGTPVEKQGRKASGLRVVSERRLSYDSGVTGDEHVSSSIEEYGALQSSAARPTRRNLFQEYPIST